MDLHMILIYTVKQQGLDIRELLVLSLRVNFCSERNSQNAEHELHQASLEPDEQHLVIRGEIHFSRHLTITPTW